MTINKKKHWLICIFALFLVIGCFHAEYPVYAQEDEKAYGDAFFDYYFDNDLVLYVNDAGQGSLDLKMYSEKVEIVSQFTEQVANSQEPTQVIFVCENLNKYDYIKLDKENSILKSTYSKGAEDIVNMVLHMCISVQCNNNSSFEMSDVEIAIRKGSYCFDENETSKLEIGGKTTASFLLNGYEADSIIFYSSDDTVITVKEKERKKGDDPNKVQAEVTAVKAGSAKIIAQFLSGGKVVTAEKPFYVYPEEALPSLNMDSLTFCVGEKVTLSCNNLPKGATVTYGSSAKSRAAVDKKTGVITGVKAGSANVVASIKMPKTATKAAYTLKLTCKVKVKTPASKVVTIKTLKQLTSALTSKKGGYYQLGANIKGVENIKITKGSYRLDLNGYTISGSNTKASMLSVEGGNLTITDSKGKGAVKNTKDQDAIGCTKGTLTIYGGSFLGLSYAIYSEGTGTTTIYGGTFTGRLKAIKQIGGTLKINGGVFKQTDTVYTNDTLVTLETDSYANTADTVVIINGGTFNGVMNIYMAGLNDYVTINGGTFNATETCLTQWRGTTIVNYGKFTAKMYHAINICPFIGKAKCTINGGIAVGGIATISMQNEAYVTINGGRFSTTDVPSDFSPGSPILTILETASGSIYTTPGLISGKELNDETMAGRNLIATEFKKNKTVYKKNMNITKPNDLYSAYCDAVENLNTTIKFSCTPELYEVLLFFMDDWVSDESSSTDVDADFATDSNGKEVYQVTITKEYSYQYELQRIAQKPSLAINASEKARTYDEKINGILKKILKSGMTDSQKIEAIHDYMVKTYSYDYSFAPESYTIAGLLDKNKGVCQAYATLFQVLCSRIGVPCGCITGLGGDSSNMDLHMWNVVVLDKKEYYVDVTFDDTSSTKRWFMKDEKTFYADGLHKVFVKE